MSLLENGKSSVNPETATTKVFAGKNQKNKKESAVYCQSLRIYLTIHQENIIFSSKTDPGLKPCLPSAALVKE
jgi:hypothetical protein